MNSFRLGGFARSILLAAASIVLAASASGGANHWTSNGPYGGNIGAIVVDPTRAGTAYVTARYGVFRTMDAGANWVAVNQGLTDAIRGSLAAGPLAIDPVVPTTLYVGFQPGGLFKSVDSGASWQQADTDAGYIDCIAVDPQTPTTIYVCGGAGAALARSDDGGATWYAAAAGLPNRVLFEVVIDPIHPSNLYARVNDSETPLYRTQDGGASWVPVAAPAGDPYLGGVTFDASLRIFVSTNQGVFRSTDAGATWVNLLLGSFLRVSVVGTDLFVAGSSADPSGRSFPNTALRSSDGGDQWTPLEVSIVPSLFAGSAADANAVYAGSSVDVLKSTDGGVHWTPSSNGMQAVRSRAAMDPANPGLVYATSGGGGLFSSVDGGRSWSAVSSDSRVGSLAIQPGTLDLFSEAGRSEDGGVSWQPIPLPDFSTVPVIAARAPQVLFAGNAFCAGLGGYPGKILKSEGGATWNVVYDAQAFACTSPVVSPSGRNVFSPVDGFSIRTFVQSRDGGATWIGLDGSGLPEDSNYYDSSVLAIDPTNEDVVYAHFAGKLWRSLVGGGQWREVDAGIPPTANPNIPIVSSLVVDPVTPTQLYASTAEGVYRSLDWAASWSAFNDGLPESGASGLLIDATGRFLHVAAAGGVYDYEIGGSCAATPNAQCLLGGRFVATVQAIDPRTGRLEVGTALSQTDRWGYFSLPGFTGDPNFPEIVVKMADATSFGEGFWVFHSGLTDLQYTLSVVDTVTGQQKSYQNDRSDPQALCGGADTGTFTGSPSTPAADARVAARASASAGSIPLLGRFTATLSAIDPRTDREAVGVPIPKDAKWGYFSLPDFTGDASFPEVFVKMLDATSEFGSFWVFHTGLTDLEYTLTVTDAQTGAQRVYRNERTDPSRLCGGADTDAFRADAP